MYNWNERPTPSPMQAITTAVARKMTGSATHDGTPEVALPPPKKMSWSAERCTVTGKTLTATTSTPSATGASPERSRVDRERRKPAPMPRKLPSSTKFEKNAR